MLEWSDSLWVRPSTMMTLPMIIDRSAN